MKPRLFGIPATEARVVAVIRRGPSDWAHVGAWHLESDTYKPGAWLHGVIYPQKCDLSPDGRWLVYSAMQQQADWAAGAVFEAVSRLPWLTALAAWSSGTTYTRGLHFTSQRDDPGIPDVGAADPVLRRFGLRWTPVIQFAVERRKGWAESSDTPPRESGGPWDELRSVTMVKSQPGGNALLSVTGRYAAFRSGDPNEDQPLYALGNADEVLDAQWADWDHNGDLLLATSDGVLRRRSGAIGPEVDVADLSLLSPDPQPPPDWAWEW